MKSLYKITSTIVMVLGFFLLLAGSSAQASESKVAHLYMGDYEMVKYESSDGAGRVYRESVYTSSSSGKVVKDRLNSDRRGEWTLHYYYTDQLGGTQFILQGDGEPEPSFRQGGSSDFGGATNPIFNNLGIGSGSGNISKVRYFPYGSQITDHNPNDFPVEDTYTGQKKDQEVDLMYYNARLYDPEMGVFVQADSNVTDGLNRYLYVKGDPVSMNDPNGEFGNFVVGFVIGAGVDFGFQVASGMIQGKGFVESVKDVNWVSVGVSGAAGALTSGASAIASVPARVAVMTTVDFAANVALEAIDNPDESIGTVVTNAGINTAVNAVGFGVAGYVGGRAVNKVGRVAADVLSVGEFKDTLARGVGVSGSTFKAAYNEFVAPYAMRGGKGKVDLRIHPEQLEIMRMYREGNIDGAIGYARDVARQYDFSFNFEEGLRDRARCKGFVDYFSRSVVVDAGLDPFEKVKVSAHELGHVLDETKGFQARGFRWNIRGSEMRQQFFNAWAYWMEGDEPGMKRAFYYFHEASEGVYGQ